MDMDGQELTRRGAALMEAFTAAAEAGLTPMEWSKFALFDHLVFHRTEDTLW